MLLRKQQLATEYNRKQVLRHHFTEWQRWYRADILKRELALTKEETRRKMNELLKAASLGKLRANGSSGVSLLEEATAMVDPPIRNGEVHWVFFALSFYLLITCIWALHLDSLEDVSPCQIALPRLSKRWKLLQCTKFIFQSMFIFLNWIFFL